MNGRNPALELDKTTLGEAIPVWEFIKMVKVGAIPPQELVKMLIGERIPVRELTYSELLEQFQYWNNEKARLTGH